MSGDRRFYGRLPVSDIFEPATGTWNLYKGQFTQTGLEEPLLGPDGPWGWETMLRELKQHSWDINLMATQLLLEHATGLARVFTSTNGQFWCIQEEYVQCVTLTTILPNWATCEDARTVVRASDGWNDLVPQALIAYACAIGPSRSSGTMALKRALQSAEGFK